MKVIDPRAPATQRDLAELAQRFETYKEGAERELAAGRDIARSQHRLFVMLLDLSKVLARLIGMQEERITALRRELGLPVADDELQQALRQTFESILRVGDETPPQA